MKAFFKKHNRFISILLSLLGFSSSCIIGPMMYGMPEATFVVKGNVKSESGSGNIPGIRVILRNDTSATDASGNYRFEISDFPEDQRYSLLFRDIDSIVNREYSDLDTVAEFKDPVFTGKSGDWYAGKAEITVDVKLPDKD